MDGELGFWCEDDEIHEEGCVDLDGTTFWIFDDTAHTWYKRNVGKRPFSRGLRKGTGKGKGSSGICRSKLRRRKGKEKGKAKEKGKSKFPSGPPTYGKGDDGNTESADFLGRFGKGKDKGKGKFKGKAEQTDAYWADVMPTIQAAQTWMAVSEESWDTSGQAWTASTLSSTTMQHQAQPKAAHPNAAAWSEPHGTFNATVEETDGTSDVFSLLGTDASPSAYEEWA